MNTPHARRQFLTRSLPLAAATAGGALLAPASAHAIEPFSRAGQPRFSLSLAAYSFRDSFPDASGKAKAAPGGKPIDLFQFLDYCADHGCDGAELTSYYFPPDTTTELLLRLKRHAFLRGLAISGTAVGNTFTLPPGPERDRQIKLVRDWIDRAAILGAPHIRVFAGNPPPGADPADARRQCIRTLQECCDYAGTRGVFLGLENHGGIVAEADDLLAIVRAVESPWFGVNLDSGNFHSADPYADLARCAPYAVNVQVKIAIQSRGQPAQDVDLGRVVKILREANYQGFVALEYEGTPDPWTAVPAWLDRLRAAL